MAVGNHHDFNDLENGKAIAFAPGVDSITFDNTVSAASLVLKDSAANLKVVGGEAKSVTLKTTHIADITVENFIFQDGSQVVVGTADGDSLIGTCYGDQIYGLDGDDSIFAGSASTADFFADKLFGGNGNDTLDGAAGDDTMVGGNGNDTYYVDSAYGDRVEEAANGGTDTVVVQTGSYFLGKNVENLTLTGGATVGYGNKLANVIEGSGYGGGGGYGNLLAGDAGNDTISGGAYGDFISGDAGNDVIYGGAGGVPYGDRIEDTTYSSGDWIFAGKGNDVVYGGAGMDFIIGDVGNDTLFGGDGWDSLETDGPNLIDGGAGNDLIVGGGYGAGGGGYGGLPGDMLLGQNGNDTISAGDGNDVAYGGTGNDSIDGGNGDDTLTGENGNDSIDGGGGNDRAYGGNGADTLMGGAGCDTLSGGNGADSVTGGYGNDWLTGGSSGDTLDGGSGADHLDGGDASDRLYGGDGCDTLIGGAGTDTMVGGYGNDTYFVDVLTDKTDESTGDGIDTVVITGNRIGTYTLAAGIENLDGSGSSRETGLILNGNELNNEVTGTGLNDKLAGKDGDDFLSGGSGNDLVSGDAGYDTLRGGDGNDTLSGGADDDTLYGSYGDDLVAGGDGNDIAYGGSGIDTLVGGNGDDTLSDDFNAAYGDQHFGLAGGDGFDVIQLAYGQSVDFTAVSDDVSGIEAIDMTNHGANSVTLGYADVLNMSGATGGYGDITDAGLLYLDGGEGDAVFLSDDEADWSVVGTSDGYDIYYHAGGNALLYIDSDVSVIPGGGPA